MTTQSKLFALAAIVSVLTAAGAHAQPVTVQDSGDRVIRTEAISYADLDLSRSAGAKALVTRITGAAKTVCSPEPIYGESDEPYKACVKAAVEHAMAQINKTTMVAQLQSPARDQH
jgi:UrcA family protein